MNVITQMDTFCAGFHLFADIFIEKKVTLNEVDSDNSFKNPLFNWAIKLSIKIHQLLVFLMTSKLCLVNSIS